MHGAIKALLDVVPAHDTLEMGAESAKLLDVAILILVNSKWLLGALLLFVSSSASFSRKKRGKTYLVQNTTTSPRQIFNILNIRLHHPLILRVNLQIMAHHTRQTR